MFTTRGLIQNTIRWILVTIFILLGSLIIIPMIPLKLDFKFDFNYILKEESYDSPPKNNIWSSTPKIIWMCWFQGWNNNKNKPLIQQLVYKSCKYHNKDDGWNIILLDNDNIPKYINSTKWYHYQQRTKHGDMGFAGLSNIVRMELLSTFGGVWVDATVFCMKPVSREPSRVGVIPEEEYQSDNGSSIHSDDGNKDNKNVQSQYQVLAMNILANSVKSKATDDDHIEDEQLVLNVDRTKQKEISSDDDEITFVNNNNNNYNTERINDDDFDDDNIELIEANYGIRNEKIVFKNNENCFFGCSCFSFFG